MDTIITVSEDIPGYLLTYWVGVLVGMGYPYKIDRASPLYRTLRERKREGYQASQAWREEQKANPSDSRTYILSGIHKEWVQVIMG